MITKKLAWLLLGCSLLFFRQVQAQGVQVNPLMDIPKIIPPSPNAASLGKYGDVPVGEYNGTASVSVPVHNISVGKYALPITLNYSSSGLKVEEKSSWIGLGWSLSAGGVITRSVHGKADEKSGFGYWNVGNWTDSQLLGFPADQPLPAQVLYSQLWYDRYDLEPDVFYYNFAGKTGKFVMDTSPEHTAHCIPYQNLKIEHSGAISSFNVTDENGNVYTFDVPETTLSDENTFISAWYLSKIVTSSGSTINFSYTDFEFSSSTQRSEIDFINTSGGYAAEKSSSVNFSAIEVTGKVLKQIDAPGQTVKFYASKNRRDIPLNSALDSITVQDDQGLIKKRFTLNHSYFGNLQSTRADDVRLKLDRIDELSVQPGQSAKSHQFTYYSPELVPAIDAKSQDYWGYFNGYLNSSLLPSIDALDFTASPKDVLGGNRSPVADMAITGTLKSIKYPTGDSTTFVYEGNDRPGAGEREKIKVSLVATGKKTSTVNIPFTKKLFSFTNRSKCNLYIVGSYSGPAPVESGPTVIINKINSDGTKTVAFSKVMINSTTVQFIYLDPGDYEMISSVDGTVQSVVATLSYYTSGDLIKNKAVGGLRIKQIINSNFNAGVQSVKNYKYVTKDDPTLSSGVKMSNIQFVEVKNSYVVRTSYSSNYLAMSQGGPIGYKLVTTYDSADGTLVNNGKKESYYTTNPPNLFGQTYLIINGLLSPVSVSDKLMTDFDVCRGFLSREAIYNDQNILVKEVLNNYNLDAALNTNSVNYFELPARKGYMFSICKSSCPDCSPQNLCGAGNQFDATYVKARVICPWIYKINSTERVFDQNGLNPIEQYTQYYYENPLHAQITKTEVSNSKGEVITTTSKYPQDNIIGLPTSAEAARQSLITSHTISPVLEQTVANNGIPIQKIAVQYRNWTPLITEPETVIVQNGAADPENRVQFFNYDLTGNVLEMNSSNRIHEVYLWGYNTQYPVAKIVGSDYSTVSGLINQSILNNPVDDQQLRSHLNTLRTALPQAQITDYTYSRLVGMTSSTDPKGLTSYFEYDGLLRLQAIKDQSRNIIKSYEYHYKP